MLDGDALSLSPGAVLKQGNHQGETDELALKA